jgi:hypothetical protein
VTHDKDTARLEEGISVPASEPVEGNWQSTDLAAIDRDYPPWRAWQGVVGGLVYARRPRSTPPLVVRATSADDLRAAIEAAERKAGLR